MKYVIIGGVAGGAGAAARLRRLNEQAEIIMLEKGHIVEEGTYQELIDKKGKFAALVERQRLDT